MPYATRHPLIRLIYVSAAVSPWSDHAVAQLLDQCRRHNAACGVTGILVTCDQQFFQVLEGPHDTVRALYSKICGDARHTQLVTLVDEPLEQRAFAEWSMAHASITRTELQAACQVQSLTDLHAGLDQVQGLLVRALLNAFLEQTHTQARMTAQMRLHAEPS